MCDTFALPNLHNLSLARVYNALHLSRSQPIRAWVISATNQSHIKNSYYYHSREMHGLLLVGKLIELDEYKKKMYILPLILMTSMLLKLSSFSRSLPSLRKPEWSQSKQKTHNTDFWKSVLWHIYTWGMVSFCGRCRNKNANNTCASIQMWYRVVRLVARWTPYSGSRWSSQSGLL